MIPSWSEQRAHPGSHRLQIGGGDQAVRPKIDRFKDLQEARLQSDGHQRRTAVDWLREMAGGLNRHIFGTTSVVLE